MTNPPALSGVDAPADATITLSASAFTFNLASFPTSVANLKLIICASAPQSNGISRAYSKAAAFDDPLDPTAAAIDIEAKYGTVSAGNPKVFFKYFYINTATGEKSGEMLEVAKSAAEQSNSDYPSVRETGKIRFPAFRDGGLGIFVDLRRHYILSQFVMFSTAPQDKQ